MRPIRLKVKDFLSFQFLDYSFEDAPILLIGENRTDEGQENNGSGKTSIQSAIEKCILDYTSRKRVRDQNLVRHGCSISELELWIECPVRRQTLHIRRVLRAKGSNELYLDINGEMVSFATVNDGNNFIIEWLGISKEDISNYYIVNKERFNSFFSSSNTQKLQLLTRFSNTTFLDNVDQDVKNDIVFLESDRENLKAEKNKLEGKVSLLKDQIASINVENFEADKKRRIERVKADIDKVGVQIAGKKTHIKQLKKEIAEGNEYLTQAANDIQDMTEQVCTKDILLRQMQNDIEKANNDKKQAQNNLCEKQDEMQDMKSLQSDAKAVLAELNVKLAGLIVCPKCHHEFFLKSDDDVEEIKQNKVETEEICKSIEENIALIKKELGDLDVVAGQKKKAYIQLSEKESATSQERDKLKRTLSKLEGNVNSRKEELAYKQSRIKTLEKGISDYNEQIVRLNEKISSIESEEFDGDSKKKELEVSLSEQKDLIKAKNKEIKELDGKINMCQFLVGCFREFRMYLSNIGIKEIQSNCNEVLRDMDSDLRVIIDGFKKKADGTIKEEITPSVIRNEALPFDAFSGGERGRLEFAMILAQQKIINSTNEWGGFHFLFTDEIAEGIDAMGLRLLIQSLNKFNFPILITTHVVNQAVGSKVMKVIKENGISRIE